MSWTAVARKDFNNALRSRSLLGLVGLFVLFYGAIAYFYAETPAVLNAGSGSDHGD